MNRSSNSPIKWKIRVYLSNAATFLEIVLAILLTIALGISILQLIPTLFTLQVSIHHIDVFHEYLEALFVLVIGVEALKLLCKHTPGSALEVILFTIARDMIVSHTTPVENFLVVLSIGLLFAIRKFLFVPAWGSENEISAFEKAQKICLRHKESETPDSPETNASQDQ